MLEDTALELGATALSPLSKTEYALAAPALSGGYQGDFAPFGDVYLSTLEFVARVRNRASAWCPKARDAQRGGGLHGSRAGAGALDARRSG